MNAKELIKILQACPNDIPIWLGVDSGEGYVPLNDVFCANCIDLPIDMDENTGYEHGYVENDYKLVEGDIIDDDSTFEISIYRPVIILGREGSLCDCQEAIKYRLNKNNILESQKQAKIAELEKQLEILKNS